MQLFLKSTGRRQEVFYSLATFLKVYTSEFSCEKYFIVVNLSFYFILTRLSSSIWQMKGQRWHPQGKHKKESGTHCRKPSFHTDIFLWKFAQTVRKYTRKGQDFTLKASLALLCGCLQTITVRIRQSREITQRTDTAQVCSLPWTATMLKANAKTPAAGKDQDVSVSTVSVTWATSSWTFTYRVHLCRYWQQSRTEGKALCLKGKVAFWCWTGRPAASQYWTSQELHARPECWPSHRPQQSSQVGTCRWQNKQSKTQFRNTMTLSHQMGFYTETWLSSRTPWPRMNS